MLKSYRFPKLEDVPEMVVGFVLRAVELPECTLSLYPLMVRRATVSGWESGNTRRRPPRSTGPGAAAGGRGQWLPVFALAHLLGFDLMPRTRNW
jgi:hypothetical protein